MPFASIIALAAALLSAAVDPGASSFPSGDARVSVSPLLNGAPEPPASEVRIGDAAPDFSYEGFDGRWRNLHDLRAQGAVLLVIAPDAAQLRALEIDRASLIERGVVPVAILDATPRATAGTIRKLGLRYSVIADPRRVIAEQFNAIQSRTHAAVPAWFVIDHSGAVRALDRGRFPSGGYLAAATTALGLPAAGAAVPTAR